MAGRLSASRSRWAAAAIVLAAILFWVATSRAVYEVTSPPALSWHVWLRKAYSLAAFALLGLLADRALPRARRATVRAALLVAVYSAVIEVGQAHNGSHEGLVWNLVDVAMGAAGGGLGAWAAVQLEQGSRRA